MDYHYNASCVHVLDDFLFIGPANTNQCLNLLENFLNLCKHIGVPIKSEKTVYPSTTITFLGLEFDSEKMELRLPDDKLLKLQETLNSFKRKKKASLRDLQSLIGLLNFACSLGLSTNFSSCTYGKKHCIDRFIGYIKLSKKIITYAYF